MGGVLYVIVLLLSECLKSREFNEITMTQRYFAKSPPIQMY